MSEKQNAASLQTQVRSALKDAMRARDELRTTTLRGLLAAFVNEAVARGRTPQSPLTLEEERTVVRRLLKQREEAAALYRKGGRDDLAQREEAEAAVLRTFLPPPLSDDEVRALITHVRTHHPDARGGRLIGLVLRAAEGRATPQQVQLLIDTDSSTE